MKAETGATHASVSATTRLDAVTTSGITNMATFREKAFSLGRS